MPELFHLCPNKTNSYLLIYRNRLLNLGVLADTTGDCGKTQFVVSLNALFPHTDFRHKSTGSELLQVLLKLIFF